MINVSVNHLKLPEKAEDMCKEASPDGWLCSLRKPHIGLHVACLAVSSIRRPDGSVKNANMLAVLAVWDHNETPG